jgi:hypothetical protein
MIYLSPSLLTLWVKAEIGVGVASDIQVASEQEGLPTNRGLLFPAKLNKTAIYEFPLT